MAGRVEWFFGPSAAGKGTLIEAIAADEGHPLRVGLGLGAGVDVCQESFDTERRGGLSELLAARIDRDVTLLVKGQTTDMTERRIPQGLRSRCQQGVVFVWADLSVLQRRCAERAEEQRRSGNARDYEYWRQHSCEVELFRYQIPEVQNLGIPTSCVKAQGGTFIMGSCPPGW